MSIVRSLAKLLPFRYEALTSGRYALTASRDLTGGFRLHQASSDVLGGLGTGLVGGGLVGQADEDDVPMLWQTAPTMIASAVATLAEERKRSWRFRDFCESVAQPAGQQSLHRFAHAGYH